MNRTAKSLVRVIGSLALILAAGLTSFKVFPGARRGFRTYIGVIHAQSNIRPMIIEYVITTTKASYERRERLVISGTGKYSDQKTIRRPDGNLYWYGAVVDPQVGITRVLGDIGAKQTSKPNGESWKFPLRDNPATNCTTPVMGIYTDIRTVVGTEDILGQHVDHVHVTSDPKTIDADLWMAPDLGCAVLRNEALGPQGHVAYVKMAVSIKLGEPDPKEFDTSQLVETRPMAANQAFAQKFNGGAMSDCIVKIGPMKEARYDKLRKGLSPQ